MDSIIQEFREFFLRNVQVNSGSKADKEMNFPIKYQVGSSQVFNRFLKDNFPSENVFSKLFNSITFKLNLEDTATTKNQGLVRLATNTEVQNNTNNTNIDYSNVIQPGQLPLILGTRLLGQKIGFDMNSTLDQLITLVGGSKYIITDIVIKNSSGHVTVADNLAFYSGTSRSGNAVISSGFSHTVMNSILTSNLMYVSVLNQNAGSTNSFINSSNNLYASLITPQGSAMTCDILIYGYSF